MKLNEIKLLNESFPTDKDEILEILTSLTISHRDCSIHPNGVVDVHSNVDISNKQLTSIPIQFGIVSGEFLCNRNKLTSLKGSPTKCKAFYCDENELTALEFAPSTIMGNFDFDNNYITSLIGINDIISEIHGEFHCEGYKQISSGGLGLLLIKNLQDIVLTFKDQEAQDIINKYLGRPDDIFECQNELIEAGLEEYAQL